MSHWPAHPTIYEINTWVWLHELSRQLGRPVTLGTVPQSELRRLARLGFDGLWLMGVWRRSPMGRRIAQDHPELQAEYHRALSDYTPDDVVGSPFSILGYEVDPALGGGAELAGLRQRLESLGLQLILDFVPNHLAVDHPWVTEHPERFVRGTAADLEREPGDYYEAYGQVFAHGRDPFFPGWTDTVQLDYRSPATRRAMADALLAVAECCDGVRCDMAMLVTREVFLRTWGGRFDPPDAEFWPSAIAEVKSAHPGFLMMAEVYWDLEYTLQQMGFDYTYDKRLYDRLVAGNPTLVREHLAMAALEYQQHLVRFVENHDERRALEALGAEGSQPAAALALTLPGARLVHEGQMEGFSLRLPVQLGRRASEAPSPELEQFYSKLLAFVRDPVLHRGQWRLLEPHAAWPGNLSHLNLVAHRWALDDEVRLVAANLAPGACQSFLPLDLPELDGSAGQLQDLFSNAVDRTQESGLLDGGLHLDLPGHGVRFLRLKLATDER